MFGHPNLREVDRRLRLIEQGVERAGKRASSTAVGTADHVTETVASVWRAWRTVFAASPCAMKRPNSAAIRRGSATMRCVAFPRRLSTDPLQRWPLRLALASLRAW